MLSPEHRDAPSELRLTGVLDGQIRNVVIDRSFVDEQGQRWVIDYKTGTHPGADLAGFLREELARYRSQLELYRALARAWGRSRCAPRCSFRCCSGWWSCPRRPRNPRLRRSAGGPGHPADRDTGSASRAAPWPSGAL